VFEAVKFDAEKQCAAWLKIHKHTHTPAAGVCLGTHLDSSSPFWIKNESDSEFWKDWCCCPM